MTVVLSPNDVPGFLASVRSMVSVPESVGPISKGINNPRIGVPGGVWICGAFAILITGVVCFALMYSPGPPQLTLTSNALTIHDHFYPFTVNAADIDVGGIKIRSEERRAGEEG